MITCKNCGFEYEGKFCPQCGQKAKTKRITNKAVLGEIRERLLHFDQGFVYTIQQLFLRPGQTIRDYLAGKRVKYAKPIKFMLWAAALNFLVLYYFGIYQEILNQISAQAGKDVSQVALVQYIFRYPSLMLLLLIPNIAFFSWLFFRKTGYNYAEHIVLNAYLMGEVAILGIVVNPLVTMMSPLPALTYLTYAAKSLWVLYLLWAFGKIFPHQRIWLRWLQGLCIVALGYGLLIVVFSLLATVIILAFKPWIMPYIQ
ncbi:MAG: DUF3667 domain-containing protein [Saprospiraceae bacterium]|nr:DUF3667 domain-containing protein [Saprospiraceae bacterium]